MWEAAVGCYGRTAAVEEAGCTVEAEAAGMLRLAGTADVRAAVCTVWTRAVVAVLDSLAACRGCCLSVGHPARAAAAAAACWAASAACRRSVCCRQVAAVAVAEAADVSGAVAAGSDGWEAAAAACAGCCRTAGAGAADGCTPCCRTRPSPYPWHAHLLLRLRRLCLRLSAVRRS